MPNATEANVKAGAGTLVATTGLGNTAIGTSAGQAVTGPNPVGMANTLIGASSGKTITTGINNVFLGYAAGISSPAGLTNSIGIGANVVVPVDNTVVLGDANIQDFHMFGVSMLKAQPNFYTYFLANAGNKTTNAVGFLGIGQGALGSVAVFQPNQAPAQVIAIGHQAMSSSQSPGNTVAVGVNALQNFGKVIGQQAIDTVAFGNNAFKTAAQGIGGVAVGHNSLINVVNIGGNTGLGDSTLASTTTGIANLAAGFTAATGSVSGSQNCDLGYGAGRSRTTGDGNVTLGFFAGVDDSLSQPPPTSGSDNVFIGRLAASRHLSGDGIVALGAYALKAATSATGSVALGYGSLQSTTTGTDNLAVGYSAAALNTSGSRNVDLGAAAGRTRTMGDGNVAIGYAAGFNGAQKSDAQNSVALGAQTYTTKDNQVVIGNDAVTETLLKGIMRHTTYLVANLPLAASVDVGARAFVTNATNATFGATVVGGGATKVPVYSDGTNWKIG